MGVGGQRHAPSALPPRKRPGTHCTGGLVGPRAGLDGCGKSHPPLGFDPRTVQPIASSATNYWKPVSNTSPSSCNNENPSEPISPRKW